MTTITKMRDHEIVTAENEGTARAGREGTATAGEHGVVCIQYWDGRHRLRIGYVGEDGIEPGVPYRLDRNARFVAGAR